MIMSAMNLAVLLPLLMVTFWLKQSDGICTLVLTPQNDGGKMDLTLDCSLCYFDGTFDVDGCDIYKVLGLDTLCTGDQCHRTYFLHNSSTASNTKMEAGRVSPAITIEEDGQESPIATLTVLGALIGFLLLLLGFVICGWAWTCWTLNKLKKTKIHARINNYVDTTITVPDIPHTNASPNGDSTPPPVINDVPPHQNNPQEPAYGKIELPHSLRAQMSTNLTGLGYAVPIKRQVKLKPSIKDDVIEEENDDSGYTKLEHTN